VIAEKSKRGFNVVALDAKTHKLIMNNVYDTYKDISASAKFISDFNNLPTATVIAVAVKDEGSKRLS